MEEKTYQTAKGVIHYWVDKKGAPGPALVLLPGLTADHRLFDKQIEFFEGKYPLFVWDAPGHATSWPFALDFTLMDKARWLDEILTARALPRLSSWANLWAATWPRLTPSCFPKSSRALCPSTPRPCNGSMLLLWSCGS